MMFRLLGLIMLVAIAYWMYRKYAPVRGLRQHALRDLSGLEAGKDVQLLDVRDYLEFEEGHYHGAVNLSLGRLSSFWRRYVKAERPLVLLGGKPSEVYRAARFLRAKGFRQLSYALYESEQESSAPCRQCPCC
ncbi:rhodanese-like domain-containing protein [Paenibacillus xanthanilyticus]|uniref:Rhodanese-like domain-containing protein n=1 Tax=Paenibacillus xanthanilyticus TaxID=1783531 RepID=A0ABV8KBT8_9BACL